MVLICGKYSLKKWFDIWANKNKGAESFNLSKTIILDNNYACYSMLNEDYQLYAILNKSHIKYIDYYLKFV